MAKRKFDYDRIIHLCKEGYTEEEIAKTIGAKSVYNLREILHNVGLKCVNPKERLDIPKVHALQKAGWSAEKIQDEFGYRFTLDEIRRAMT